MGSLMQNTIWGRLKGLKPNTFIGGIGNVTNTPTLLAAKLGISTSRVNSFKINGINIECNIKDSYIIPHSSFLNSTITYFIDTDGLITKIDGRGFRSCVSLTKITANNTLYIGDETFTNTYAKELFFPNAIQLQGGYGSFRQNPRLTKIDLPNVSSSTWVYSGMDSLPRLLKVNLAKLSKIRGNAAAGNYAFSNSKQCFTLYISNDALTSNAGSKDVDVAFAETDRLADVRYVTNFEKPNRVTDLTIGNVYSTSAKLVFTPPTIHANDIDYYEVFVNGVYNNDTKEMCVTGLKPNQTYEIAVKTVDVFYNKSDLSNTTTVTIGDNSGFISSWDTTKISTGSTANNQIKLPLSQYGNYNFIVDWGDGTQNTITSYNQAETTHTYTIAGNYILTIKGICEGWCFNYTGDRLKFMSVSSWGNLCLGDLGGYFCGCENLSLTTVGDFLDLHNVTETTNMFNGCTSITIVNNMENWLFGNVLVATAMFKNCTNFNHSIGTWKTYSLRVIDSMFEGCVNFNQSLNNWRTNNLITCNKVFMNCSKFNQPLNNWNVGNVTTMLNAFQGCSIFNQDLGTWNVSKVTDFTNMFLNCTAFNNDGSASIGNWQICTTANVSMVSMFNKAAAFNQNIGSWNVSAVTTMESMFLAASAFNNGGSTSIDSWNTINVTTMHQMFSNAVSFNQPIGGWNTSRVTTMQNMFLGAVFFNNGGSPSINNWNTSNVTTFESMFFVATGNSMAFNQPIGNWNTSKVVSFTQMFTNCSVFNQPIGTWDTSSATAMNDMFYLAKAFNQNIGAWNVSKVTNFNQMFVGALAFNNGGSADINNWALCTTGSVILSWMFSGSVTFNQPIGNWNTIAVTNMNGMFYTLNNSAFNQNIGSWNISNVSNFSLFMLGKTSATYSTANLDAIYNGWSTRPVKTPITIDFSTIKYTSASSASRAILTGAPNNWTITDGGM